MRIINNPQKIRLRQYFIYTISIAIILCTFFAFVFNGHSEEEQSNSQSIKSKFKTEKETAEKNSHGSAKANRLVGETSPYLLMHAYNPVDWYPWGPESFERAKDENKPIFLSIGYSSCYWCHVMERESFMDSEIAKFLNDHFICIKVDREERPDVDDIYMTAIQILTQRGGWPLTVFMTPEGLPFLGGTYFPARQGDRGPRIGFLELITSIAKIWSEKPEPVKEQAKRLTAAVAEVVREQQGNRRHTPNSVQILNVQQAMQSQFDDTYGGFGQPPFPAQQPKFPSPPELLYLADRVARDDDQEAEKMLLLTLDKMSQGGIRDHVGGGFHRYSVDRFWKIPHFEKMLYDNAQLASVYAEAYSHTGNKSYRNVAEELLEFTLREMRDPGGGFYSAIDAETDAEEGKFYRWEPEELKKLLGEDAFSWLAPIYSFADSPNFEHEGHAYYVLQLSGPIEKLAADRRLTGIQLEKKIAPLRDKLLNARSQKKRPLTDTKVLTAWNGLMIRGLADAGRIFKDDQYLTEAESSAKFALKELRQDGGRLSRSYRKGTSKLNAYLVDYAFLVDGLLALHRATEDPQWLQAASEITDQQLELFWDDEESGFFYTSEDHEALIARAKKQTDSVLPSANSVSALNLIYLANHLPKKNYKTYAEKLVGVLAHALQEPQNARRMPTAARAIAAWLASTMEKQEE